MNGKRYPAIERNLFLPALAGFFVAGVWLGVRVAAGLWPLWLGALALLALLPLKALRLPLRLIALPLALMAAILWTQHWLNPAMPAEGKYEGITATVYGQSKIGTTGNVSFTAVDVALNGEAQPGKAYCTVYVSPGDAPPLLTDGMRIHFDGKVYRPYPKENVYDFDFSLWMLERGIAFGIGNVENVREISAERRWANAAQRIASACRERLRAVMGEDADLAVAMLLGYRNELAEDDAAAFRRAGVAHVMAVSGLHVGILSFALLWLLEKLRFGKKWQIPVVAVFLFLYCGVTGFAVSSMRAGVMVLLWVVAKAYGRKTNPVTILSAAMLIVLVINPLQLFSAGFTLSFSAVAGIFLLQPRILQVLNRLLPRRETTRKRNIARYADSFLWRLKQAVAVSLAAQLGVTLPIAAYYHNVYPYSLPFNLLIVPLAGILVPLYALTAIVVWIPWAGVWLGAAFGAAAKIGSDVLLFFVRLSDTLPMAELRVPAPGVWVSLAAAVSAVAVSHLVRAPVRRRALVIAVAVALAAAGSYAQRPPELRYHQFAAGSADSALIVDHGVTVGIDTGNTGSEMIGRLLAEGRDLDMLILTHLHTDHAGGVGAILDAGIRIRQAYLPVDYDRQDNDPESLAAVDRLRQEGVPIAFLAAGDTVKLHETTIDVLWPEAGRTRLGIDPNDRSLAMLITLGGVRILSMADNGELYERYAAQPADILKTGHHGSKTSSTDAFLLIVDPSAALFTARAGSAQPAKATLERFRELRISTLNTGETGEIIIVPAGDGYRIYRTVSEANP